MMPLRLKPAASRSRVNHSTTEALGSLDILYEMGLDMGKNCLQGFANNKGTDQQTDQGLCYSLLGKYHI